MFHLLPPELIALIRGYLPRADAISFGRANKRLDTLYRNSFLKRGVKVLEEMNHYLVGVSLNQLICHMAYAQIVVTRSPAQRQREIDTFIKANSSSCFSICLRKTTTIQDFDNLIWNFRKKKDVELIRQAVAPVRTTRIMNEVIPLRFFMSDSYTVLILDVFGNLYYDGELLLSQVREVVIHPKGCLIMTFAREIYMLHIGKLTKIKPTVSYTHLAMGGAIATTGEFYRIIRGFDQRPSLDATDVVHGCAYFDFLDHDHCKKYLLQHRKFYLDTRGRLYHIDFRGNTSHDGTTTTHLLTSNVRKFIFNSGYSYLLLIALKNSGEVSIYEYVYRDELVTLRSEHVIPSTYTDLVDDGHHGHLIRTDNTIVTVTYDDNEMKLICQKKKSLCPPLDLLYQTYEVL